MNREEFLNRLGAALNGEVPPSVIQENLNYYDGYIREEAAKGRTEEEIIAVSYTHLTLPTNSLV